jgi:hypothetical protein
MYASQDAFLFKILVVYDFTRNFADNRYVCGIHKANVEKSYCEASWQLAFKWLIAFLPQILHFFEIVLF